MTHGARFAEYDEDAGGRPPLAIVTSPLDEGSLEDVARLYAHRQGMPLERARAFWQKTWRGRDASTKRTLVARDEAGVLVGYANLKRFEASEELPEGKQPCPAGWYLAGVIVDERFRRRGVASELVRLRLVWLREHAVTRCYYVANEHNRATIALHERFGFTPIARDVVLPGVSFAGGVGVLFVADLERG